EGMRGHQYDRPPMPSVWARKHGDGRVYYNSLGHREDVWANPLFQNMLMAGFSWTMGKVDFDPVTRVPFELAEGMGGRP
ncbi:MAG: ThuA domain-containing protein, partial [Planctomycetaceae bacterium]